MMTRGPMMNGSASEWSFREMANRWNEQEMILVKYILSRFPYFFSHLVELDF